MIEGASDFFVAAAGAAAALAGLIIVALSVSVEEIIKMPGMTARSAASIALLVAATLISLAGLIPGQTALAFGLETLVAGLAALAFSLIAAFRMARGRGPYSMMSGVVRGGLGVVPSLLFMVGAVLAVLENPAAMQLLGIGMLLAIAIAVTTAWVLLVEIRR
ncbi:MAG: hypothetical protein DI534_04310 [Leifsonia xyli]|nr:MAG: hypothetical protein DI534_04310 [Leifsonia xyli]